MPTSTAARTQLQTPLKPQARPRTTGQFESQASTDEREWEQARRALQTSMDTRQ